MTLILRTATLPLTALLLLFSVFILLRGHDSPGGGFIGGLVAGGAFSLFAMAHGVPPARRALGLDPRYVVALGLALSIAAGILALTLGDPYLTQYFLDWYLPIMGGIAVGTTLIFDIGVYLAVSGMVVTVLFRLLEVEQ
jgi:multicomponent Na+:H+ antiporter subunit B